MVRGQGHCSGVGWGFTPAKLGTLLVVNIFMRVKPILPQKFVASVETHVQFCLFFTEYGKFLSYGTA
jgi:hypothetical protein